MVKFPFLWFHISTFMTKHEHGVYYAYEDAFGNIPEIIQFTYYIIWDTIYYYDLEDKYPQNNNRLAIGSESSSSNIS